MLKCALFIIGPVLASFLHEYEDMPSCIEDTAKVGELACDSAQAYSGDPTLIVLTAKGELISFDGASGQRRWTHIDEPLIGGNIHKFEAVRPDGTTRVLVPSLDGQLYEFEPAEQTIKCHTVRAEDLLKNTVNLAGFVVDGNIAYSTTGIDPVSGNVVFSDKVNNEQQGNRVTGPLIVRKTSHRMSARDERTGKTIWTLNVSDIEVKPKHSLLSERRHSDFVDSLIFELADGRIFRNGPQPWSARTDSHLVRAWTHIDGHVEAINFLGSSQTRRFDEQVVNPNTMNYQVPLFYLGTEGGVPFIIQATHEEMRQSVSWQGVQRQELLRISDARANSDLSHALVEESRQGVSVNDSPQTSEANVCKAIAADPFTEITAADFTKFSRQDSSGLRKVFESSRISDNVGLLISKTVKRDSSAGSKLPDSMVRSTLTVLKFAYGAGVVAIGALAGITGTLFGIGRSSKSTKKEGSPEQEDEQNEDTEQEENIKPVENELMKTIKKSKKLLPTDTRGTSSEDSSWSSVHESDVPASPAEKPIEVPKPPSRFTTDFKIIRKLGVGAFGTVYEAESRFEGLMCAIKRVAFKTGKPEELKKVKAEVVAMAKLDHKGLVRYYQCFQEESNPYEIEAFDRMMATKDIKNKRLEEIYTESSDRRVITGTTATSDGLYLPQKDSTNSMITFRDTGAASTPTVDESKREDHCSIRESVNQVQQDVCQTMMKQYLYIVVQLCEPDTLSDWLYKNVTVKARPVQLLKKWMRQLLDTVSYLHCQRMIHRDLKDEEDNLKSVKIGDFGLVSMVDGIDMNYPKDAVGTRIYMAPEQSKRQKYTSKVDIFAIGLICLEYSYIFKTTSEKVSNFSALQNGDASDALDSIKDETLKDFISSLVTYDAASRPSAQEARKHHFLE